MAFRAIAVVIGVTLLDDFVEHAKHLAVAVGGPGRWIHVAGQVRMDADGKVEGDLATQTHATLDHIARILGKLGVRDRTQAVVVAYESGLVTPRTREPI